MIATHNRPNLLREALTHASRQKDIRAEVLVVDDASDYDAETVIAPFRSRLQVKLVQLTTNHGYAAARNIGIHESSAEIIIQLDDDSWLIENDAARVLTDYLRAHHDVGALAIRIFHPWSGSPTGVGRVYDRWKGPHLGEEYSFHGCGVVFRREVAVRAGTYPAVYTYGGEEDHLAMRILQLGYRIQFFGERGVVHGYDDIVEDPKSPETLQRNRVYYVSHLATTFLALFPFPLNVIVAAGRIVAAVCREKTPMTAILRRIAEVRRAVRPTPMGWRQAIRYLRLRRDVRRRLA